LELFSPTLLEVTSVIKTLRSKRIEDGRIRLISFTRNNVAEEYAVLIEKEVKPRKFYVIRAFMFPASKLGEALDLFDSLEG